MALTRECKNPSRIAREIEIYSIFAWLVPTLVPKHNSRFRVFRRTICWSCRSINIYETFGRNRIRRRSFLMESCFCALLRNRPKFEEVAFRKSLALDLQTLHRGKTDTLALLISMKAGILLRGYEVNTSILEQNKSTLWVLGEEISWDGISIIGKWKFTILQNRMIWYTYKESPSPERLAYRSRWLDILP